MFMLENFPRIFSFSENKKIIFIFSMIYDKPIFIYHIECNQKYNKISLLYP